MGVVYRARDRVLDRTVAVKVLPVELADDHVLIERFEREARAVARLSHPNIVSVYDSGRDADVRYIVMEYVPGVSLAQLLREREQLPVPEAVEIAAQIASALAAAHAAGIVHRDVKPGNVMVDPSGAVKVLDFGIARATTDIALTRTAMVLGSAPYIAPETALGRSADARSDIYSLGCVLYEMLTGRPPFIGELPAVVMNQHATAEPLPPRELRPEIPGALEALVLQMLAKLPLDRPQSARELVGALRRTLQEPTAATAVVAPPARASPVVPPPAPVSPVVPAPAPVSPRAAPAPRVRARPAGPPPQRKSSPAVLALIVAVLAAAVGVAVALAVSSGSGAHRTTTTSGTHTASTPTTQPPTTATTAPSTSTTTTTKTTTTTTSTSTSTGTSTPTKPTARSGTSSTGATTAP